MAPAEPRQGTAAGPRRRLAYEQPLASYSLTWDNVQVEVHGKHHSSKRQNKFLLWALCFAHQNKVPRHLPDPDTVKAVEVDPFALLPSPEVLNTIRGRMITVVTRILADNLTPLHMLRDRVVRHIPHPYSREMRERSNIVNLGVVDANPSSTEGVIDIMEHLHQFVPVVDGQLFPILCCGDGLSIERMVHCKRARSNGATPAARLQGLVEGAQEFHKEILLLQDTIDMLFTGKSEASRGTLSQLKAFFNHRSMKARVQDNVQHAWDMVEFATCAYVCLLGADICGMGTAMEKPADMPVGQAAQQKWLRNIAQRVVDFCWLPPDHHDIMKVVKAMGEDSEEEIFPYCNCFEDKDDAMIQCCSGNCKSSWYHLTCAGLQSAPEGDWFCSQECEADSSYIYCICHQKKGGMMVQCHLQDKCLRTEWYHRSCLTQDQLADIEGRWYCSADCLREAESEDFVQNYSKALLWEGLCHLTRRDCVREGDGPAIIGTWQLDILSFWRKKHYKYFIITHQMLTGIGGFLPARLRQDLVWNRVGNVKGGPGKCIGLDLINEFLNNDFKEMLKHSRGQYTEKQVQRVAEMGGSFGQQLDRLFSQAGLGRNTYGSTFSHDGRYAEDITKFVEEFQGDGLFEYLPGRAHSGFENFQYTTRVQNPEKMGAKIRQLSKEMDMWAQISDR